MERRHPEGRERARAFTSGRAALRDLMFLTCLNRLELRPLEVLLDTNPRQGPSIWDSLTEQVCLSLPGASP